MTSHSAPAPPPRPRPTLTITAGPISSGKSDWVRSFRNAPTQPLCLIRDEVRLHVGGESYLDGPVDQATEDTVTRLIHESAQTALTNGRDVYIDGCHNHPLTRNEWEAVATSNGAGFRLMLFDLPLNEILALNGQRATPHSRQKVESSFRQWSKQFSKIAHRPQHRFLSQERSQRNAG